MTDAEDRFDRINQGLDRIIQDDCRQFEEVRIGVREIRRELSALQKDFRKHLLWHLGGAS